MGRISDKRCVHIIAIILFVTFLYGCSTIRMYTGKRLPREKIAIIKQNGTRPYYIFINEIDGKPVNSMFKNFEVLPGVHTLRINVMGSFPGFERKEALDTISFLAEADYVYRIDGWLDEQGNAVTNVKDNELDIPVALER